MDTQWFDDVLVLLEERNMSRAAARRNITQPAFSRRIRSFENWLGVDILERKSNRIDVSRALSANEGDIRALVLRLRELRTKIVHHQPAGTLVAIAAQHSPMFSTFPDMALRARNARPDIRFRTRAGNLSDCVSMFLRGDTSMLLCYEGAEVDPVEFGPGIRRGIWGHDYLIPVVGGSLRYAVRDSRAVPDTTPAIIYPDDSFFGQVLARGQRPFGTAGFSANPICQTAFTSGAKEMALKGLGVTWLPFSMVHSEIESGALISLAQRHGQEALDVAIYAARKVDIAMDLLTLWTGEG